jgi:predicted phosphodiesterase
MKKSLVRAIWWGVVVGIWIVVLVYIFNREPRRVEVPKVAPTPTPTVVAEKPFKFGVMADVHMNWTDWRKLLKTSKEKGEELILVAGDMTSLGKKNELLAAKKVLDESGVNYMVVPGNHDMWESDRIKKSLFEEVFGKEYQSFKRSSDKFILVNNGRATGLGIVQRRWLEGEVKECKQIHCMVIMHMPLNHNLSAHIMGEKNKKVTQEAQELIKLFKDNGVVDILAGHLHYSGSYELEGLRTSLVGAVTRERNTQTPRYTEFALIGGQLERLVIEGEANDIGD